MEYGESSLAPSSERSGITAAPAENSESTLSRSCSFSSAERSAMIFAFEGEPEPALERRPLIVATLIELAGQSYKT